MVDDFLSSLRGRRQQWRYRLLPALMPIHIDLDRSWFMVGDETDKGFACIKGWWHQKHGARLTSFRDLECAIRSDGSGYV